MKIKTFFSEIKDVIGSPNSESENGCDVSPCVLPDVGEGVGFIIGGGVGIGIGLTSTHENVISFKILKKFSARSGPPSNTPVPQGGL